jgi:hypothetical protein
MATGAWDAPVLVARRSPDALDDYKYFTTLRPVSSCL